MVVLLRLMLDNKLLNYNWNNYCLVLPHHFCLKKHETQKL